MNGAENQALGAKSTYGCREMQLQLVRARNVISPLVARRGNVSWVNIAKITTFAPSPQLAQYWRASRRKPDVLVKSFTSGLRLDARQTTLPSDEFPDLGSSEKIE